MKKKKGSGIGGKLTTQLLGGLAAKASRKAKQKAIEAGVSLLTIKNGKLVRRNADGSFEEIGEHEPVPHKRVLLKKGDVIKIPVK